MRSHAVAEHGIFAGDMRISDSQITLSSADLRADLSLALGAAYIIGRELGDDGMSRVFVAHEELSDRDVLVKVLGRRFTRGLSAERFAQALQSAASLEDAHTIPIFTAGEVATGLLFYTMPYVRADSLRNRVELGPVGFYECVAVLRDVARAMAYSHERGVFHHNLTPEKVLLAKGGALVAEFGLARALAQPGATANRATPPEGISLSPRPYRAPELSAGDPRADHRADIYAWGVMACELLLDADPLANAPAEPGMPAGDDVPPLLLFKRHGVPEQLALLVMRCCEKTAASRPASAAELVELLERMPDPAVALAIESKSATRWIGVSMVVALAVFIASGAAVYKMQRRETRDRPILAILPFESSGIVSDSLFAEGLEMGVTTKLMQLTGLRVIDRRSVISVADGGGTPQSMGQTLGAQYVLRTSIRWLREGGATRVRVSPVLVTVEDGTAIWVNQPQVVSLGDPFKAQGVIARQAAQELDVFLSPEDRASLDARPTSDTAAFAAATRGNRRYPPMGTTRLELYQASLREFERAYQLDPLYADALGSAALLLARMGQTGQQPNLLDSATALARRTLAINPNHTRALIAKARVALAREQTEEAAETIDYVVAANPSSIEALRLRAELLPLLGDSAGAWRDVLNLVQLAPRSADAMVVSATTAQSLRRFGDSNAFLERAGMLEPDRPDLMLRVALLARSAGDFARASGAVREYRRRGGRLTAVNLDLVRSGDAAIRRELADASPETYDVTSRSDSIYFYVQKALYFLGARNRSRAQTLFDSAAVLLKRRPEDASFSRAERRRYGELRALTHAARGERDRALAAVTAIERTPIAQQWPRGKLAALTACNGAEIYAFLDHVEQMITQLRSCLTLPGGYAPISLSAEPAIWRHASDPRLHSLLDEFNIQIRRKE